MFSLKKYSTFRIAVSATELVTISHTDDLLTLIHTDTYKNNLSRLIIGGGSNILFTQDFDGLIIHNKIQGKTILKELNNSIIMALGSGENRHDIVMWSVEQGYAGLENLVSIPGTVGAAPVQNIGAYGTEARDIILEVRGIDMISGKEQIYTNEQCEFGYRDSIFKHTLKQDFFITEVVIQLIKANERIYHPKLDYNGIHEELFKQGRDGGTYLSPKQVAQAISTIRGTKLPDWTTIGTAGSFFANPIVSQSEYEILLQKNPEIIGHQVGVNKRKLSAGQLIELVGLKGYRDGDAGIYDRHALILVNYGGATGIQMKELISHIQDKVQEKFNINLIPEVNIL